MSNESIFQAFRPVPRTGVIYVSSEARTQGYDSTSSEWSNLGQGQPETGPLPGAPERVGQLAIDPADHEYAPIPGLWELREAVASFYNQIYRRGLPSQYSAENVSISSGGRAALTRAVASLGRINLGHFLPDYTAYEELLDIFRLVSPIPILLEAGDGYRFETKDLEREVLGRGLAAVLASNPSNPMGKLVSGQELREWIEVARRTDCSLLLDEFYSHYIWRLDGESDVMVSAARYVEDVERDPVLIFDGLTKNWRYPGWRVTWTVGPRRVIEAVESAGSFLDGGSTRPLQRSVIPLLDPEYARMETEAVRRAFLPKRDLVLKRARGMGLGVDREPDGTFYLFASLQDLPEPLRDCMTFFRRALEYQVICVPGVFFDVNPGRRRARRISRFRSHVRLSFGPSLEEVSRGLDRLERMIREAS